MRLFVKFFFFKQKTAYEMRISDWSSDVCSSDLADFGVGRIEFDENLPSFDMLRVVDMYRGHGAGDFAADLHQIRRYVGIVGALEVASVQEPVSAIGAQCDHDDGGNDQQTTTTRDRKSVV